MSRYNNTPIQSAGQDPLDSPLIFTRFKNVSAKVKAEKTVTLRELVGAIPSRIAEAKSKLPLIKLATFGDVPTVHGSLRHDANMLEVYGIEIDYDAGDMPPSEAVERFRKAGIAAAILTSPSHLQPGKGARWRGLLPLSKPVRAEQREQYVAWANGLLGGVLGTESFTASQTFYAGAVEGWHPVEVHLSEGGRYLDTATELAPKAIGKPNHVKTVSGTKLDTSAALAAIRTGASYHESLIALAGHWANDGVPLAEARLRLEDAMKAVPEDDRRPEWADRFRDIGRGLAFIYGNRFKVAIERDAELMADFDLIPTAEEEAEIVALVGGREDDEQAAPKSGGLSFLTPAECATLPARAYVIKGLLAEGDVAAIIGAPGAGKSLLAPRLGYAVAQGAEVFGRRTRQGGVLYIAAEDGHGMRARLSALRADHGEAEAFHLVGGVSDLLSDKGQLKALRAEVKARRPALIFIDTLAVAFPGLEENSAEGMGKVVAAARSLARWGAAVVLIHHDTKAGDGLPRGHSLLNGALDVSLYLKREADVVAFKPSKNRNGTTEQDFAFTIGTRRMGTDEDGDPITTAICEEADAADMPRKADKLPPAASAAYVHLRQLSPDGKPVTEAALLNACVSGRNVSQSDVEKSRRDACTRALRHLMTRDLIEFDDGFYSLKEAPYAPTGSFTDDFPEVGQEQ